MENHNWFNKKVEDVEKELHTNIETGLTDEEVKQRREKYGLNQLKEKKKKSMLKRFLVILQYELTKIEFSGINNK